MKKKTMDQSARFIALICSLFFFSMNNVDSYLGINWGRTATQRILPAMVVDMLLQNGIPEVKVFAPKKNVLSALIGTNLGVTVTIANDDLKNIDSLEDAKNWINANLSPFVDQGLNLRYIGVGTWPFSKTNFNKTYFHAVEALNYTQRAVDELSLGNGVKVTLDHYVDVMNKAKKPSEAEFAEDVRSVMLRSTEILVKNNAPILLDMFPFYNAKTLFNETEFAFFDNNSTSHFMDEGYTYTNIFEVVYDKFVCALEKEGFQNIKIVVGQVGWPTDGIADANINNAERFHKGLVKHILSGKGTPRRPGPIDAYIHNLADENQVQIMSGGEQGGFMRHWGIYTFDGKPKYQIDFSGKGREVKPYSAVGITHMPKRWCVFNQQTEDVGLIRRLVLDACMNADCSPLEEGGSCSNTSFIAHVSYAFNVFFQEKSQKFSENGCDFDGFGEITPNDPSVDNCIFPVEIVTAESITGSASHGLTFAPTMSIVSMLFYSFLTWL